MCKGGNKTTQTTSNTVDPQQMKLFMQNYQSGQDVANTPFQPYTGERVAPANPVLSQSFDLYNNIAANNTGASTLDVAKNLTGRAANFQFNPIAASNIGVDPVTASSIGFTPVKVGDITPQTLAGTDLSPYMNPFQSGVIDTTLADLERSRQMARMADAQKATAAGAFGGSRSGVMAAETNRAYDQNAANALANLNLQNFDQAQNAAIGDITRDLTAKQANQSTALQLGGLNSNGAMTAAQANQDAALRAAMANATNSLAAQQANQNAALQAAQFNTNAGLDAARFGLSAGAQMGALSDQELAQELQRAGALNQVGQQQQSIQQQMDDAAYQEFLRQIAYPQQQQNIRNASLGLIPLQQTTTGTTRQSESIWNGLLDALNAASKFIKPGSLSSGSSQE